MNDCTHISMHVHFTAGLLDDLLSFMLFHHVIHIPIFTIPLPGSQCAADDRRSIKSAPIHLLALTVSFSPHRFHLSKIHELQL